MINQASVGKLFGQDDQWKKAKVEMEKRGGSLCSACFSLIRVYWC
jgi:hypothetical protein